MKNNKQQYIFEIELNSLLTGIGKGKLIATDEKELLIKFKKAFIGAEFIKVLNKEKINELQGIQETGKRKNKKTRNSGGIEINFSDDPAFDVI